MNTPAQNLLAAAEKESRLHNFGIANYFPDLSEFQKNREALIRNVRQFELCCKWLLLCQPTKKPNSRIGSSADLTKIISQHFGERITNGALIAAAIHLGIQYQKVRGSRSVYLAISIKAVVKKTR